MGRIGLAFRLFFSVLFNAPVAERMSSAFRNSLLQNENKPEIPPIGTGEQDPPHKNGMAGSKPRRSEALTLLEALQRESRLIDLCQESLDAYTDEQIGAASRNVIRDAGKVLDRFFKLRPVTTVSEGEPLEIPAGFDPGLYHLTGNISGQPPYRGHVVHTGWRATQCELPQWTGGQESALVVAAAEVEVK